MEVLVQNGHYPGCGCLFIGVFRLANNNCRDSPDDGKGSKHMNRLSSLSEINVTLQKSIVPQQCEVSRRTRVPDEKFVVRSYEQNRKGSFVPTAPDFVPNFFANRECFRQPDAVNISKGRPLLCKHMQPW